MQLGYSLTQRYRPRIALASALGVVVPGVRGVYPLQPSTEGSFSPPPPSQGVNPNPKPLARAEATLSTVLVHLISS